MEKTRDGGGHEFTCCKGNHQQKLQKQTENTTSKGILTIWRGPYGAYA